MAETKKAAQQKKRGANARKPRGRERRQEALVEPLVRGYPIRIGHGRPAVLVRRRPVVVRGAAEDPAGPSGSCCCCCCCRGAGTATPQATGGLSGQLRYAHVAPGPRNHFEEFNFENPTPFEVRGLTCTLLDATTVVVHQIPPVGAPGILVPPGGVCLEPEVVEATVTELRVRADVVDLASGRTVLAIDWRWMLPPDMQDYHVLRLASHLAFDAKGKLVYAGTVFLQQNAGEIVCPVLF